MAFATHLIPQEDVLARLADIAYQAVLRRGLRQPFVDVELEIWNDIRRSFRTPTHAPRGDLVLEA